MIEGRMYIALLATYFRVLLHALTAEWLSLESGAPKFPYEHNLLWLISLCISLAYSLCDLI